MPVLRNNSNLPDQNGALVDDVIPNTPAEKAGIKSGDVIVAFNGKEISDANSLTLAVSECSPGSPGDGEIDPQRTHENCHRCRWLKCRQQCRKVKMTVTRTIPMQAVQKPMRSTV